MDVILFRALLIALIIVGPILVIWALNTLFPSLAIAYGVAEWFAVVIISGALKSSVNVNS